MLLSISNAFHNKQNLKNRSALAYSFKATEINDNELIKHIVSGKAFTPATFQSNHRKAENFCQASIMGLDFDNGVSVTDLAENRLNRIIWLIYATPSSTPDLPKSRALIKLDRSVTNASEYERLVIGLQELFKDLKPDVSAKDCARFFYGSDTNDYQVLGNVVSVDELLELIEWQKFATPQMAKRKEIELSGNLESFPKLLKLSNTETGTRYGIAALDNELNILANTTKGNRNNQLNKSAFALGQLVASNHLQENIVREELMETTKKLGLEKNEIEPTINSGLKSGMENPRADSEKFYIRSSTDTGNQERFCNRYKNEAFFVHQWESWFIWNGNNWQKDDNGQIVKMAQTVAKDIWDEATNAADLEEKRNLSNWYFQSQNQSRLSAMVNLSKNHLTKNTDDLDNKPMLLGVKNGVIDLTKGQLLPANPEHNITKTVSTIYDENAKCPKFLAYLEQALNHDDEMVSYVQKLVGYTLTGYSNEKIMMLVYGPKDTGKTLLVNVLGKLLGDYAKYSNASTLMQSKKNGSDASPDIARLKGARLVYCDESKQGDHLNAALVKQLTGMSKRTARFLFGEYFEYDPTDKIWLATNFMPNIPTDDMAAWDRVRIIEFRNIIPEEEKDKHLYDYIVSNELSGILNWAIEGCMAYQNEGLNEPDIAKAVKQKVYADQDTIGQFLELAEFGDDKWIKRSVLFSLYKDWCKSEDVNFFHKKRFNEHIENKVGLEIKQQNGVRGWSGVDIPDDIRRTIRLDSLS